MTAIEAIPAGVGIGLRRPHFDTILERQPDVDWFEFVPENFIGRGGTYAATLAACAHDSSRGLVAHGVSVSVGGPDPLPEAHLDGLARLLDDHGIELYSDHICYTQIGDAGLYDLLPLPWTEAAAEHVGQRAADLRRRLGRPLVLEPISTYAVMPGSTLSEGEFVRMVLERADAGLLLDLNNVYVNARNHDLDPETMMRALPLDRVAYVHLAGHSQDGARLLDSHDAAVHEAVWALYETFIAEHGPVPTLLEWDAKIPELDVVMAEVAKIRDVRARALDGSTGPRKRSAEVDA